VTVVKELFHERTSSITEEGHREYGRIFAVHTDTNTTTARDVIEATALPAWGDTYQVTGIEDRQARCIGKTAEPNGSPKLWLVRVRYGSRFGMGRESMGGAAAGGNGSGITPTFDGDGQIEGGGPSGNGTPSTVEPTLFENPLLRPADVSWSTVRIKRPLTVDNAGEPIVNSAGDPFDPPLEYEQVNLIFTVVKNRATHDAEALRGYINAINSATWLQFPAKSLRCNDITATREFENSGFFWRVTFIFEYQARLWNPLKVLDAGYRELFLFEHQRITDQFGAPPSRPVLLDGNGEQLPVGDPPVFLEFNVYDEADFKDFRLF
jgi:hypothetical protein